MIRGSREKITAFSDYAFDTEGMRYHAKQTPAGHWIAVPQAKYAPEVEAALYRNFREEFNPFDKGR